MTLSEPLAYMLHGNKDSTYLACDCIVSLQSVESPFDVLAAQHPEICHEQVGSLHHDFGPHRAKAGVVEEVVRHLRGAQNRFILKTLLFLKVCVS